MWIWLKNTKDLPSPPPGDGSLAPAQGTVQGGHLTAGISLGVVRSSVSTLQFSRQHGT